MQKLADLADSFQLYAVCVQCERMEQMDIPALIEMLGEGTPVSTIRTRLRCRGCGNRTGDMRIVYVGNHKRAAVFGYR
jgi:hypothetical protein